MEEQKSKIPLVYLFKMILINFSFYNIPNWYLILIQVLQWLHILSFHDFDDWVFGINRPSDLKQSMHYQLMLYASWACTLGILYLFFIIDSLRQINFKGTISRISIYLSTIFVYFMSHTIFGKYQAFYQILTTFSEQKISGSLNFIGVSIYTFWIIHQMFVFEINVPVKNIRSRIHSFFGYIYLLTINTHYVLNRIRTSAKYIPKQKITIFVTPFYLASLVLILVELPYYNPHMNILYSYSIICTWCYIFSRDFLQIPRDKAVFYLVLFSPIVWSLLVRYQRYIFKRILERSIYLEKNYKNRKVDFSKLTKILFSFLRIKMSPSTCLLLYQLSHAHRLNCPECRANNVDNKKNTAKMLLGCYLNNKNNGNELQRVFFLTYYSLKFSKLKIKNNLFKLIKEKEK